MSVNKFGNLAGSCSDDAMQAFTGVGKCGITEGNTKALVITELGMEFAFDKFANELDTALIAASSAKRAYILKNVVDNAFEGGDVATAQKGSYGASSPIKLNAASHAFTIDAPDCSVNFLMGFNGRKVRVIRVDENNIPFGVKNDNGKFAGQEANLYVQYTPKAGDTAAAFVLHVYYTDWEASLKVKSNVAAVTLPDGLVPLTIVRTAAGKVKLVEACSGYDVTDLYAANITTAVFVKEDGSNPTAATVANGVVSLTPATGNYAVAGADVLNGLHIYGYDGLKTFVKVD